MSIENIVSTVVTGLILTGLASILPWLNPLSRWRRAVKKDIDIMSGLPEGAEKNQWEASVLWQATRIREYEQNMKFRHLVMPWIFLFSLIVILLLLLDPEQRATFIADGPTTWLLSLATFIMLIWHLVTGFGGANVLDKNSETLRALRHDQNIEE